MMKCWLVLLLSVFLWGLSCNSTDAGVATQAKADSATVQSDPTVSAVQTQNPESEKSDKEEETTPKNSEGAPKVFLTLKNEETGELKEVEANVTVKPGEKYFVPAFNPASVASFDFVNLVDADLEKVRINLDRVYLIEYWSDEGLTQNLFWSQMRQLEEEHKDSKEIEFLSINYNTAVRGQTQISAAQKRLKQFSKPKNVLFDLDDSFRDSFPAMGPVTYILIDVRKQITYFGRGDNPNSQEVFDRVRDALLHFRAAKSGGIKVVENKQEN